MSDLEAVRLDVPPAFAAQVATRSGHDPSAIAAAIGAAFGPLMGFVQQHGLPCGGPPRVIYQSVSPEGMEMIVAMPLAAPPAVAPPAGPVALGELPGGRALRFIHRGPYAQLKDTYGRIGEYLRGEGLLASEADWARFMPMWEEYLNDPACTPEADLLTHIYLPLH